MRPGGRRLKGHAAGAQNACGCVHEVMRRRRSCKSEPRGHAGYESVVRRVCEWAERTCERSTKRHANEVRRDMRVRVENACKCFLRSGSKSAEACERGPNVHASEVGPGMRVRPYGHAREVLSVNGLLVFHSRRLPTTLIPPFVSGLEAARVHDLDERHGHGAGATEHGRAVEQVPYRLLRRQGDPGHRSQAAERHVSSSTTRLPSKNYIILRSGSKSSRRSSTRSAGSPPPRAKPCRRASSRRPSSAPKMRARSVSCESPKYCARTRSSRTSSSCKFAPSGPS